MRSKRQSRRLADAALVMSRVRLTGTSLLDGAGELHQRDPEGVRNGPHAGPPG